MEISEKEMVIYFDEAMFQRWQTIGSVEHLSSNAEIGKFLIQLYDITKTKGEIPVCCVRCESPISLLCSKCRSRQSFSAWAGRISEASSRTEICNSSVSSNTTLISEGLIKKSLSAKIPETAQSHVTMNSSHRKENDEDMHSALNMQQEILDMEQVSSPFQNGPPSPTHRCTAVWSQSQELSSEPQVPFRRGNASMVREKITSKNISGNTAENKAFTELCEVNQVPSSTAGKTCAGFLNSAFKTQKSGNACKKQAREQKLHRQRSKSRLLSLTTTHYGMRATRSRTISPTGSRVNSGKVSAECVSKEWTHEQVTVLNQYTAERKNERRTHSFWAACAESLNSKFGIERTVTAYRTQGRLTSNILDYSAPVVAGVSSDIKSDNSEVNLPSSVAAQMQKQSTSADKAASVSDQQEEQDICQSKSVCNRKSLRDSSAFANMSPCMSEGKAIHDKSLSETQASVKDSTLSEPSCLYLGVEDLEVQLPTKDHSYVDQQQPPKHSSDSVYICKVCGRSFEKRHKLINHIRYVHCDWRPFVCERCPATFQSRSRLQRHVYVVHTKERPYRCTACGASFVDQFALNCHLRTHQRDRSHRYFCELCGKGYHGLNPLKKHLLGHSGKNPGPPAKTVLCWVCGKVVASASYLKLHLKKHSPDTAITCTVCCQTFTSKQVLEKHMKSRIHRKKLEKRTQSEGGEEMLKKVNSFKGRASTMLKTYHTRKCTFKCEICEKMFSSQKSKKRHKRTIHHCQHESGASKPVKDLANNGTEVHLNHSKGKQKHPTEGLKGNSEELERDKEELAQSLAIRKRKSASGKFMCDICCQRFTLQQSVQRHKRNVHFKRRDYRCDACEKTFTDSYYLKQHKQSFHNATGQVVRHTIRCNVCDKTFLAKSAMTMHKRTVHYGLRRQSCTVCCKRFRDKFTLERHQKSCGCDQNINQFGKETEEAEREIDNNQRKTVEACFATSISDLTTSVSLPLSSITSSLTGFLPVSPWVDVATSFDANVNTEAGCDLSSLDQRNLTSENITTVRALDSIDIWNLG